jgi:hypothetical protein
MAWPKPIPKCPEAITNLADVTLRRRAEAAWKAGHAVLNAIASWEDWLSHIKFEEYRQTTDWMAVGDAISRDGRTAIQTLFGLGLKCPTFEGAPDGLLFWWPWAPSDIADRGWYLDTDVQVREKLSNQKFHSNSVLAPAIREFLGVLAQSPDAALRSEPVTRQLSPGRQRIVDVIQETGHRMTTEQILAAIREIDKVASSGTTKQYLAELVDRGILDNRQDVQPNGYGLQEWG